MADETKTARHTPADRFAAILAEVRSRPGIIDDGSDGLGIIARQALADDPGATADDIAKIVLGAQSEAKAERND